MKPYETDLGRIRALYRIPTAASSRCILEVCAEGQSFVLDGELSPLKRATCVLTGDGEGSIKIVQSPIEPSFQCAHECESFDLIVLHGTLDALFTIADTSGAKFDPCRFIRQLAALLSPSGVIAGCVSNGSNPRQLIHRFSNFRGWKFSAFYWTRITIGGCASMLRQAGLNDIRVYNVLPNASAPMKIVETQRDVAHFAFGRALEARRPELSIVGYWTRRLVLEFDLYPFIEKSIYFWGSRGC